MLFFRCHKHNKKTHSSENKRQNFLVVSQYLIVFSTSLKKTIHTPPEAFGGCYSWPIEAVGEEIVRKSSVASIFMRTPALGSPLDFSISIF
jgi:hypothetical protein